MVKNFKNKRLPLYIPVKLKIPEIPRAFIENAKISYVLLHTIEGFGREEQQAIGCFYYLDLPIEEISKLTELTENHISSVVGLYSERLESKINLFKKCVPYDADDMLQINDILFREKA